MMVTRPDHQNPILRQIPGIIRKDDKKSKTTTAYSSKNRNPRITINLRTNQKKIQKKETEIRKISGSKETVPFK
jgi:hypothetical protein